MRETAAYAVLGPLVVIASERCVVREMVGEQRDYILLKVTQELGPSSFGEVIVGFLSVSDPRARVARGQGRSPSH